MTFLGRVRAKCHCTFLLQPHHTANVAVPQHICEKQARKMNIGTDFGHNFHHTPRRASSFCVAYRPPSFKTMFSEFFGTGACKMSLHVSVAATSDGKCGRTIAYLREAGAKDEYCNQFLTQFSAHRTARQLLLCGLPTHLSETTHFAIFLHWRFLQGFTSDLVEESCFSGAPLWRPVASATWCLHRELLFLFEQLRFFAMRFQKLFPI